MEYLSVAEAQQTEGLRLVLTAGVPGPYSEAAKALFRHHQVEYLPVRQTGGRDNPELVAWTGHRNAPIALYNDEPPRVRCIEILDLAERLGSGQSLYPEAIEQRIDMVGLINELAGENGLLWQARILMLDMTVQMVGEEKARRNPMLQEYRYEQASVEPAKARVQSLIDYLTSRVQQAKSGYLVGDQFSAADIYYAYISNILRPQQHDINPMPDGLRRSYELLEQMFGELDSGLFAFRDRIFENHLELPLNF